MPYCCGAVTGTVLTTHTTYSPQANADNVTAAQYVTGVAITTNGNDPSTQYIVTSPVSIPIPAQLIGLDPNVCHNTLCPQTVGSSYTWPNTITVPTSPSILIYPATVFVSKII